MSKSKFDDPLEQKNWLPPKINSPDIEIQKNNKINHKNPDTENYSCGLFVLQKNWGC